MNNVITFLITMLLSVVSCTVARAQETTVDTVRTVTKDTLARVQDVAQDTVRKAIIDYSAESLVFDSEIDEHRKLLRGNVIFSHDSAYMYCDSAYFYDMDETLEAFSNVRLEQGDTLIVYGDYLFFDSKTELAQMRYNVRMVSIQQDSTEVTLFTDSLDYNLQTDIGYYFKGGRIIDAENELVSVFGEYSPTTKIAFFKDSVQLTNPNFILYSDTLEYSTESKIANIVGPSIIEADSGIIHTTRGWYDTQDNTSSLLDRSQVFTGDRILTGDSLLYDRNLGIGEAFWNMSIIDTTQKTILTGHYGYYVENTEYAFATDSACAIEFSQGDSLFLHADTLELVTVDSTSRILRAFMGARFYRFDIQGICDSLRFNTRDSILYMYGNPVLWNEEQQLFGDSIIIYLSDSAVDYVHVPTSAFVVQEIEPGYYNQLGGNDLKAYFTGRNIDRIDIDGNAETIFYPIEQDSALMALIYMQGSFLSIWFVDGKFDRLKWSDKSDGKMTPIHLLSSEQKTLKKFAWYDDLRPIDQYDIFRFYNERKEQQGDPPEPLDQDTIDPPAFLDAQRQQITNSESEN